MSADGEQPSSRRPLTPDDLLALEELGDVALSPDGEWLAFVVRRARRTMTFHKHDFLFGNDRGDLWLVATSGGVARNLTNGERDGAGHWAPRWSPDSRRLALLSTRDANVRVWVCDVETGDLRRLCERAALIDSHAAPMVWTSDRELLVATLAEGERPLRMRIETQAAETVMREWPKAWRGLEPTASVLDSGLPERFEERPQGALVLVDAVSGAERMVLTGSCRDLRAAPDGRHVAFVRQVGVRRPHESGKLERAAEPGLLGVVTTAGDVVTAGVAEIDAPQSTSLHWSPDGSEVALIAGGGAPRSIFRYRPGDGRVLRVTGPGLHATGLTWAAGDGILAYAKPVDGPSGSPPRADWWLAEDGGEPRNLSAGVARVPARLHPQAGRQEFVGLADANVVRLSLSDGRWSTLTEDFEPRIVWQLWPGRGARDHETVDRLLLVADDATSRGWHELDLRSGELRLLDPPSTAGWLLDHAPEHDAAVAIATDRTGARLWLWRPAAGRHTAVVETNTWLSTVAEGELRRVDYRGLDGGALRGWLILPVDYEPGRRYPLIVEVYPGFVFEGETPPMRMLSIDGHHVHNPQLLAARGYAVLYPSMPLGPEGEPGEPLAELTNGVLPAIDAAIELGIADPDRVGLMGHSFGGFATYGLIAQTRRFRAAVAVAGLADLASVYGQFDPRSRYDAHPHEQMLQMSLAETGQLRMGVAPWEDPDRYVRNSPLFAAGAIETPLLVIQGDMDYVPMAQGEQLFSALYRQGRRARFVRYWGEGHVLQSPANIRDMWERIHAWFGEFLRPGDEIS